MNFRQVLEAITAALIEASSRVEAPKDFDEWFYETPKFNGIEDDTAAYHEARHIAEAAWNAALASRITGPSDEIILDHALENVCPCPACGEGAGHAIFVEGAKYFRDNLRIQSPKLAWEDVEKLFPTKEEQAKWEVDYSKALMKQVENEEVGLDDVEDILIKGYEGWLRDEMKRRVESL